TRWICGRNLPPSSKRSSVAVARRPSRRTVAYTIPSNRVPAQTAPTSPTRALLRCPQGTSSNPITRRVRPGSGSAILPLYMSRDLKKKPQGEIRTATAEPPVVARLVIEIRSDGSRTIARGMAEDVAQGERVQVQAEGATPLQLVLSLVKSLRDVTVLARNFARGLLKK